MCDAGARISIEIHGALVCGEGCIQLAAIPARVHQSCQQLRRARVQLQGSEKAANRIPGVAQICFDRGVEAMSENEVGTDGECALESVWRQIGIALLLGSEFLEEVVTPAEPGPTRPERGVL